MPTPKSELQHYGVLETRIRLINGKGSIRERPVRLCKPKLSKGGLVYNRRKVTCPACKALLEKQKTNR